MDCHVRLAWIQAIHIAGERNDLDAIEELVCGVVAHDDRGPLLLDLPGDGRPEAHPPDLTPFHRPRPRWWARPIRPPRPPAPYLRPSHGRPIPVLQPERGD